MQAINATHLRIGDSLIERDGSLLEVCDVIREGRWVTVMFSNNGIVPVKPKRFPAGKLIYVNAHAHAVAR